MFDLYSDITMPLNMEDAVRMQSDNLENAYGSKATSTRVSRRSTPLQSGIQTPADKMSRYQTHTMRHFFNILILRVFYKCNRRGSACSSLAEAANALLNRMPSGGDEQPSETLQNIVGVTRDRDAMFKTYYTDENGELVTVSMYNVEDPASLIGNDVLQVSLISIQF